MSISRKQALAELKNMFPNYDKNALNTLLRANGTLSPLINPLDNMFNQTVEYIL